MRMDVRFSCQAHHAAPPRLRSRSGNDPEAGLDTPARPAHTSAPPAGDAYAASDSHAADRQPLKRGQSLPQTQTQTQTRVPAMYPRSRQPTHAPTGSVGA